MKRTIYIIRQTIFTIFSFVYFLGLAVELTVRGFIYLAIMGKTEENKSKYHELLQRRARFVINHVPGTTFEYDNSVNEMFASPSVIISNHQSHLDLMAIMMLTPNLIILTKNWVWHNPFYGIVIRYADYLPITDHADMMSKIRERVANGYSVMVFPEGTRSADCKILRFHRGAFKMAEELDLDIVPVFISGFGAVLPKTSFHLHSGKMKLEVMTRFCKDDDEWKTGGYRGVARYLHKVYLQKNEEVHSHR